jgi:hypothetical protein
VKLAPNVGGRLQSWIESEHFDGGRVIILAKRKKRRSLKSLNLVGTKRCTLQLHLRSRCLPRANLNVKAALKQLKSTLSLQYQLGYRLS